MHFFSHILSGQTHQRTLECCQRARGPQRKWMAWIQSTSSSEWQCTSYLFPYRRKRVQMQSLHTRTKVGIPLCVGLVSRNQWAANTDFKQRSPWTRNRGLPDSIPGADIADVQILHTWRMCTSAIFADLQYLHIRQMCTSATSSNLRHLHLFHICSFMRRCMIGSAVGAFGPIPGQNAPNQIQICFVLVSATTYASMDPKI